ncbi:PREDICTED: ATP-binding cassette sub-family B member 10, mitochondrial [Bactrocera latifrons]|uniref:ATP-binding cassette sub-family B member 10, mitochondrial n=2 Tax=Bactrocera latifrons TaxID=174628 RepID=A0A0K8W1E0_BACLA|nr:PREDICTED: ATP-binding cassette sub-family B member 10, mitochondrial [Bactrocera latifrons]
MITRCACIKGALSRLTSHSGFCRPFVTLRTTTISRRFITVHGLRSIQKQIFVPTVRGNVCLRIARFRGNVSNNAQQADKVTKVKLHRKDVIRLIGLAKSEKLVLIVAMGCLVISSAITMSVPFALGKILDMIFDKKGTHAETMEKLKEFSIILLGIFVLGGLTNYFRVYLFNSASLRIVKDLRSRVYRRMLLQETGWFDTKGTGELLNRLVNDTYMIGNSLSQNLSDGLRSTVMIVAGTSMMIYTSPSLSLVSTCVVPCVAGMAIVYGRYVRNITRNLLDKFANISKSVEERLGNIKTVKGFCKEQEESKAYEILLTDALNLGYKEVQARSLFFGLTGFSGNVIIISVLYYGGILVISDALSIGALTSFILYAGYSAISINGLSNFYTELNKGVGAAQRVWEILDRQYSIPLHTGFVPKTPPRGEIKFENILFSFPSREESIILNNFNLTLLPGETTAVVGRSGSGKTTISTLLLRLYDPLQGQVLLDGIDIKELNPIWLRSHIGAVNQEPTLFSGTIRDNILYGLNPGTKVNEEAFADAIRKAHVDEFASQLPNGLNTLVGQRGMMLSGGQRQRVAIARALLKNPAILILDEATSALDSVSEELVQNAIEQVSKGRTVLTIAHRLSTIRNADKIAVLENGSVVEQGRYEELITREAGAFRELVRKQAFMVNS